MISWFESLGEVAVLPSAGLTVTEVNSRLSKLMLSYAKLLGKPEHDRNLCLDVRAYLTHFGLMLPEEPDVKIEHRKEGTGLFSFIVLPETVIDRIKLLPS